MKRVLLAFALLTAVAAGCVLSIMTEKRTTDLLIDMTDRIEEAFDAEEFDRALTLTEEFTEEFTKRTKHFTFFMRHSDVSKIEENVITLPILLEAGDHEHFPAELARCRNQLDKLGELELPSFDNIL